MADNSSSTSWTPWTPSAFSSLAEMVPQAHHEQFTSHQLFDETGRQHVSPNLKGQSVVAADSVNLQGSSDEIDTDANLYMHRMFSGQITLDAMLQILARFKESSEKREQLIFNCMIQNLFDEYKFFPEYPDNQLKLGAVLIGSLIKHQLVTDLDLGIALHCVLEALHKSVDSKMFVFGTKALEQFIDRLVEWPQYSNSILQISHLRGTHPELVSVIERAVTCISSNPSESNSTYITPSDKQTPSVETMKCGCPPSLSGGPSVYNLLV